MEVFIKIVQFILSLSLLIVVHEFGHFLFARLSDTRVEKFYMFFNPKFSLFRAKKVNGKWRFRFLAPNVPPTYEPDGFTTDEKGRKEPKYKPVDLDTLPEDDWRRSPENTEWGLGWIPLGGYCKIAGMIDESMDKEAMKQPPQPWEFRAKKAVPRLLMMAGGVLFNFLLALLLFAMTLYVWGEQYLPNSAVRYGVVCDSTALRAGLQNGDRILSIDHKPVDHFTQIVPTLLLEDAKTIQVVRDGRETDITLPDNLVADILQHQNSGFISPRMPAVIAEFMPGSPAQKLGLQTGDTIVSISGQRIFLDQIRPILADSLHRPLTLGVKRGAQYLEFPYTPDTTILGFYNQSISDLFQFNTTRYSLAASIPAGIRKGWQTGADYLKQLKLIVKPETKAYESLGGFIAIDKIFPGMWDWESFWSLTAFLSIILAIMNILPIPALDGGHILFLLVEIVTGRKPSDKVLEYAQMVGMLLLLLLLLYANGNDIVKLFR